MKMHLSRAAALALIASAPFAWGQQLTFEYVDSDRNGTLSKEEVAAIAVRFPGNPDPDDVFERWDANADGQVTPEEFDDRPRGG
jgi:hypothetical protein